MTPIPPRRRWFQFGLRTMFVVVTVVAIWLGWELKFIRERKAFIAQTRMAKISDGGIGCTTCSEMIASAAENGFLYKPTALPWWRRVLGDEPVEEFILPDRSQKNIDRLLTLFPEAMLLELAGDENGNGIFKLIHKPPRDRGDLVGESQSSPSELPAIP